MNGPVSRLGTWAIAVSIAAAAIAGFASNALAHEIIARTVALTAGPYAVQVGLMSDPPTVEAPLEITVGPAPGSPSLDGATITLTAVPGEGTDAAATRPVVLGADPDAKGALAGQVPLSVRGAWLLQLEIAGPLGKGIARLPVNAAAPAAIPTWLGWLIAMSPLLGIAWFAWWNRGYLQRLKREAARAW